ncbi:dihydroneopterin aldolase family protein [Thermosphaera chiliense]|uniref:Dihydroneopterin aldolase n=1 Tax=Thermosphaera chiliense TaxID=3402707 RepID=A0A7M1UNV6_9CREN|nr:dihydroneopterin aldolase family protein [Thermosphaera aggregans]QOR93948.1 dihydroneopterin aldolase family protein [Thermosphaera aggregans]
MFSDPARKYFHKDVTDRERAAFEAGIALGMVVHQFTGVPLRKRDDISILEKVIENAIKAQPFKIDAEVVINVDLKNTDNPYDYTALKTRNMNVKVTVKYGKAVVKAALRHIDELDYNLAYIEEIIEEE